MIITPASLSINQLFGSTNEQYVIPTYQRRYSWHKRQVWELIDDIRLIDNDDTHLLGTIVCLSGHHIAGLNKLELVDGQQRLTTIVILLECICQRLEFEKEIRDATEIRGLLNAKPLGGEPCRKVALDSIDSTEFAQLVRNEQEPEFQNHQLASAFNIIRGWVSEQSLERLGIFVYRLKNQAKVIRLDVSEAKDAFKLFETINNRGLRLSPTDIIKNFLLGNAARFSPGALQSARDSWAALIKHLDGTATDTFFRHYLMAVVRTRITASEVVTHFKKVFMNQVAEAATLPERHLYADDDEQEEDDLEDTSDNSGSEVETNRLDRVNFDDFLMKLVHSAKVYGELIFVRTNDSRTNRHLRNLRMIKAIQTYGFLMHLRVGGCGDKQFREILKLTENFILRRHVCRERTNETEALFARLCEVDPADPVEPTKDAYRDLCPSDEKFKEEFTSTSFSAKIIDRARYCLERFELTNHGGHDELQVLGADDVHVEHIVPQKIKTKKAKDEFGDWITYLGDNAEARHPKYVSRIGNLTIFSGILNVGASNDPFLKKKQAYRNSGIKITRELLEMSQFKFENIDHRSMELAKAAVELWPKP